MRRWIEEGTEAPDFTLKSDDTGNVRLADLRGHAVLLYFYRSDRSRTSAAQAVSFRERHAEIASRGVRILAVSPDPVESHSRFRLRHSLNFPLLSDPECRVAAAYGAVEEREKGGRRVTVIRPSAFLIDSQGFVRGAWPKVGEEELDEVVEAIGALPPG